MDVFNNILPSFVGEHRIINTCGNICLVASVLLISPRHIYMKKSIL